MKIYSTFKKENKLSKKVTVKLTLGEIKSLIYIVSNHYSIEQFDNKDSYASNLLNKLESLNK